jgi:hypothetical protein
MQQIYWYVTAVIAAKFFIQLHAVQILSTHIHEVLTDTRGLLPAFNRERNRLLANALKCHRGWPEEVFQRAPTSCVELHGVDAILSKIAYTLANCVEAGLVNDPTQWPGVTVHVDDIGRRVVEVERPDVYFDPKNPGWPPRAQIKIEMPSALEGAFGERALDVIRAVVASAIDRARKSARKAGRFVSGPISRLFSVPITRRSGTFETFGGRDPTFATGGDRAAAIKAREDRRAFLQQYRAALVALRKGIAGVPFPAGAWRWPRELIPAMMRSAYRQTSMSVGSSLIGGYG